MATWEERLDTAATEAEAATDKAETAAQIFYDVANGTDTETVTTVNGEVKTLAKFNTDNQVLFDDFLTNNQSTFDTFILDSQTEFNNELATFQNEFDNAINIAWTDAEEAITEEHILTSDTDTITLTGFTNDGVALYVEGSREFNFTKSGSNDVVFGDVLPSGTTIWAVKRNLEGSFDISTVSLSDSGDNLTQTLAEWINDFYTFEAADFLPDYTGNSGDIALKVNTAEDGVEWAPIFPNFTGNSDSALKVNATEDGVEWSPVFPEFVGNAGNSLKVNSSEDGVEWSPGIISEYEEFTASGTWNKDPNATWVYVEAIGGGGGGSGEGGGGGAYAPKLFRAADIGSSETITVGSGGVGGDHDNGPSDGGASAFGTHLSAPGGGQGTNDKGGNGGGGELGAQSQTIPPVGGFSSGGGGSRYGDDGADDGADCVMGGAGGGGDPFGDGGVSANGGNGGDAESPGEFPGGGGGSNAAGADGVVRIWQW